MCNVKCIKHNNCKLYIIIIHCSLKFFDGKILLDKILKVWYNYQALMKFEKTSLQKIKKYLTNFKKYGIIAKLQF